MKQDEKREFVWSWLCPLCGIKHQERFRWRMPVFDVMRLAMDRGVVKALCRAASWWLTLSSVALQSAATTLWWLGLPEADDAINGEIDDEGQ